MSSVSSLLLSLFFIDEVSHYKQYDAASQPKNGIFADMFEEEYQDVVSSLQTGMGEDAYFRYLNSITPAATHAGYFSIDKKGRMTNSKLGDKKEQTSDDIDAYDLIMKSKELLLDRDPKRSPVRFIFSHSALREGWDNPNVFPICTLKQSGSDVRKRQEVGRGLRLCVNQDGERMDTNALGNDVHNINVLTVIASESYDSFAKGLQTELADSAASVIEIVDSVYDSQAMQPENAHSNNVELQVNPDKLAMPQFKALWERINGKSIYIVDFDTDELIKKAIDTLNHKLRVSRIFFKVESGQMDKIKSREDLLSGTSFVKESSAAYGARTKIAASRGVKYDLVGKLVEKTGLTRKTIIAILTGIDKPVFDQFKDNPEEFIIKTAALINDEKTTAIIEHITYDMLIDISDAPPSEYVERYRQKPGEEGYRKTCAENALPIVFSSKKEMVTLCQNNMIFMDGKTQSSLRLQISMQVSGRRRICMTHYQNSGAQTPALPGCVQTGRRRTKRWGQCSITAFLAQDIFGGEVHGILRPGGNYHCYNVIGDCVFDLTSGQFGDEVLNYSDNPLQSREVHFSKGEKRLRYEKLKADLREFCKK